MLKLKRALAGSCCAFESDQPEMKMIPLHAGHGFAFDSHADEVCVFLTQDK